ncbi:14 kDa proline-rich protein DC2.15-like [Silene latifolia]|uniref:14 kDa proline-rich protein DC2.15-like n=1 Tax=Silene latifolia TaxID=37657 RepID=UPI003D76AAF2
MASKTPTITLLLCLNLVFFTLVSSNYVPCPPTPSKPPSHHGGHHGGGHSSSSKGGKCPIDTLKLGVCANVLNGLVDVIIGVPPKSHCCHLLEGLTDLNAALCLCTAIKADLLGIHLDVAVSLSLLLNYCGKSGVPSGFKCPKY